MKVSVLTDIGQKRSSNQDYVNKFDNKAGLTLIVLADGMGGHKAGNIASELTVVEFGRSWVETDYSDAKEIREWFLATLEVANQKVHEMGQNDDYRGMGTTVEAAVVVEHALLYAHVGDSRIGLIRDGVYTQLTNDHSLVNALVQAGQLTVEEAKNHPQKNIITQSVGQGRALDADLGVAHVEAGDIILMNSDGLTNMVSIATILEVITDSTYSLDVKAKHLIDKANEAGGLDNITVALLELESEDQP